jgi:hypothetical protein
MAVIIHWLPHVVLIVSLFLNPFPPFSWKIGAWNAIQINSSGHNDACGTHGFPELVYDIRTGHVEERWMSNKSAGTTWDIEQQLMVLCNRDCSFIGSSQK